MLVHSTNIPYICFLGILMIPCILEGVSNVQQGLIFDNLCSENRFIYLCAEGTKNSIIGDEAGPA